MESGGVRQRCFWTRSIPSPSNLQESAVRAGRKRVQRVGSPEIQEVHLRLSLPPNASLTSWRKPSLPGGTVTIGSTSYPDVPASSRKAGGQPAVAGIYWTIQQKVKDNIKSSPLGLPEPQGHEGPQRPGAKTSSKPRHQDDGSARRSVPFPSFCERRQSSTAPHERAAGIGSFP